MNKRIDYLDAMRGFAILLVVVGHLVQRNTQLETSHPLYNLIYSFHMPLFFFICGCSQWLSCKKQSYNTMTIKDLVGGGN